jgi:hypothetical protein
MESMLACETRYRDHQQRMAWLNEENWKCGKPARRYPVRQAVAKALIAFATALMPTPKRETQAA